MFHGKNYTTKNSDAFELKEACTSEYMYETSVLSSRAVHSTSRIHYDMRRILAQVDHR